MTIPKKLLMLFVAVMLFASNMANAACCCFEDSVPEMQMETPCHDENASNSDDSNAACEDCECQSCVKTLGLVDSDSDASLVINAVLVIEPQSILSNFNSSIYSPPKHIS